MLKVINEQDIIIRVGQNVKNKEAIRIKLHWCNQGEANPSQHLSIWALLFDTSEYSKLESFLECKSQLAFLFYKHDQRGFYLPEL